MRLPLIITTACVLLIATTAWLVSAYQRTHHDGRSSVSAPEAENRPIFTLQDTSGRQVTDRDLHGRINLVYFGFTTCPDVCPTELGWMVRTMRQLGPLGEAIQPVLITVDPERDTPEKLAAYASAFHPRLLALTGTPEQIKAAADAFGVIYRKQTPVSQQPGFYLIDHTMTTFVLDRDGRILHRLASHDLSPADAATLLRPLAGGTP